jgi:hypothetical protein
MVVLQKFDYTSLAPKTKQNDLENIALYLQTY